MIRAVTRPMLPPVIGLDYTHGSLPCQGRTPISAPVIPEERQTQASVLKLRNDIAHDPALHIREPEIAACITIGQLLVVDTKLVEDRRMQIVDRDTILHGL